MTVGLLFGLLLVMAASGCGGPVDGCRGPDDCAAGRACSLGRCVWPEDLALEMGLDELGGRILAAVAAGDQYRFAAECLTELDLSSLFEGDPTGLFGQYKRFVVDGFLYLRDEIGVSAGDRLIAFEPGRYSPIKKGEWGAKQGIDSFEGGSLLIDRAGTNWQLPVERVVLAGGRWKLFYLR